MYESMKTIHPLVQRIFYLQVNDIEYEVKVTKNLNNT